MWLRSGWVEYRTGAVPLGFRWLLPFLSDMTPQSDSHSNKGASLDRSPRIRAFTLLNRVPSGKFNRVNFRYTIPLSGTYSFPLRLPSDGHVRLSDSTCGRRHVSVEAPRFRPCLELVLLLVYSPHYQGSRTGDLTSAALGRELGLNGAQSKPHPISSRPCRAYTGDCTRLAGMPCRSEPRSHLSRLIMIQSFLVLPPKQVSSSLKTQRDIKWK